METQLLPQIENSVAATYELSNLLLSQLTRVTQMSMAHTKLMMSLTQNQITASLTAKTPEEAMSKFNENVDSQIKNMTEFGTDLCELGLSFQSEDAQFVESHVSKSDASFQHLFEQITSLHKMSEKKS